MVRANRISQMIQEETMKSTAADAKPAVVTAESVPTPEPEKKYEIISDEEDGPSEAESKATKAPEMSKRDKRRAREARKKAEEEERKAAAKEARKAAKKAGGGAPPPPPLSKKEKEVASFVQPKRKGDKGKGKGKKVEEKAATQQDIEKVAEEVNSLRSKMTDKWAEDWTGMVGRVRGVFGDVAEMVVLCLGLGKPFGDRTAKIQLAFILELAAGLGAEASAIRAFDPVFEDGDVQLLKALGCEVMEENLVGVWLTSWLTRRSEVRILLATSRTWCTCRTARSRFTSRSCRQTSLRGWPRTRAVCS